MTHLKTAAQSLGLWLRNLRLISRGRVQIEQVGPHRGQWICLSKRTVITDVAQQASWTGKSKSQPVGCLNWLPWKRSSSRWWKLPRWYRRSGWRTWWQEGQCSYRGQGPEKPAHWLHGPWGLESPPMIIGLGTKIQNRRQVPKSWMDKREWRGCW